MFIDYIVSKDHSSEMELIDKRFILQSFLAIGKNINTFQKQTEAYNKFKIVIIPTYLEYIMNDKSLNKQDVLLALDLYKFYENLPDELIKRKLNNLLKTLEEEAPI